MINIKFVARYCALGAYLGLIAWILIWNSLIAPSTTFPVALILLFLLLPLLAGLRGMLHGRRYTHAWVSMLTLLYFIIGVSDAYADPDSRIYGWGLIILSLLLFAGTIVFIRFGKLES